MSPFLALFLIFIAFVVIVSTVNARKPAPHRQSQSRQTRRAAYEEYPLPETLGIRNQGSLSELEERIRGAFARHYGDRLIARLRTKHPSVTEAEARWRCFELQRYFLMTALLRDVPMFSPAVDEVWHEMLMFTREYEAFCAEAVGRTIHHAPHGDGAPVAMPELRAWFDWVYSYLFEPAAFSEWLWGRFYRYPLSGEHLDSIRTLSNDELMSRYGNEDAAVRNPRVREAFESMMEATRSGIETTKQHGGYRAANYETDRTGYGLDPFLPLAGAMLAVSVLQPNDYSESMVALEKENEELQRPSDSTYACSSGMYAGDDGDSNDGNDGGGDSGGGSGDDSGGSSCSSSSCSSSSCSSSSCSGGSSCSSSS